MSNAPIRRPRDARRGSTLVLVTALLVLLVIIATAYLSRTQGERVISTATQESGLRDDRAAVIAEDIATEISSALFVRPIDTSIVGPLDLPSSNIPRLAIFPDAVRYGRDYQDSNGDGQSDFTFNFPPFHTVPFTNWPDSNPAYPRGDNNAVGLQNLGEGNPTGNPGYGDTRWLRDLEPQRALYEDPVLGFQPGPDGIVGTDDDIQTYSHWRHLTNIARAENGWRICWNISDVLGGDGFFIVNDMDLPVEQWLSNRIPIYPTNGAAFDAQWEAWFTNYANTYSSTLGIIPPNLWRLADLGPRENEFIEGTDRWRVSKVLADADGDGLTDSFWFLAPTMIERGLRQVVGISITDNSGRLNVNTAGRFVRSDFDTGLFRSKTRGRTPGDVALVGQNAINDPLLPLNTWNVGFLDSPFNQVIPSAEPFSDVYGNGLEMRFRPENYDLTTTGTPAREQNLLSELAVKGNSAFPELLRTDAERAIYFRAMSEQPDRAALELTPFTLSDDLELRLFRGSNSASILSRLERTLDTRVGDSGITAANQQVFLRSDDFREETIEYLDQLTPVQLLRDNRWKLTTRSGARNDIMPPWMWPSPHPSVAWYEYDTDLEDFALVNLTPQQQEELWWERVRKADLRADNTSFFDYVDIIRNGLTAALTSVRPTLTGPLAGDSYFGSFTAGFGGNLANYQLTHKMIASLTANIAAARDADDIPLKSNGAILDGSTALAGTRRLYPGFERQPFLVEAFIGHVYPVFTVPIPYPNAGAEGILRSTDTAPNTDISTTIVVVQIANPFDAPLPLNDPAIPYELEIFGQSVPLLNLETVDANLASLPPSTNEQPRVLTLYAVADTYDGQADFGARWLNFLDVPTVGGADPFVLPGALSIDMNTVPGASISLDRDDYETGSATSDAAVQLVRIEGGNQRMVLDRIDLTDAAALRDFGDAVNDMENERPPLYPTPAPPTDMPFVFPGGWELPGDIDGNYWVQWRRAARSYGFGYGPDRSNPRFVVATKEVFAPQQLGPLQTDDSFFNNGNCYRHDSDPDGPWFTRQLELFEYAANDVTNTVPRKPTTFNFRWGEQFFDATGDGAGDFFPDTGVYTAPWPMQMLIKNADFERVGELSWIWLWGPELTLENGPAEVKYTFSEIISRELPEYPAEVLGSLGETNRLRRTFDSSTDDLMDSVPASNLRPNDAAVPSLPSWVRIFDAFTCDGSGLAPPDLNGNGTEDPFEVTVARTGLANSYNGRMTSGLINVNTAPVEVLRAIPHFDRLVHEINAPGFNPRSRIPEAIVQYRDRLGDPNDTMLSRPAYRERGANGGYIEGLRAERGMASPGELLLLKELPPNGALSAQARTSYSIDFAGLNPFDDGLSTRISLDTLDRVDPLLAPPGLVPDDVRGDVEELAMLGVGALNMLTTRSDVFTVHFVVRTFRQNPITGRWDATDREYLVDESRYVMLVDRSEVNAPSDSPTIHYLERAPR